MVEGTIGKLNVRILERRPDKVVGKFTRNDDESPPHSEIFPK